MRAQIPVLADGVWFQYSAHLPVVACVNGMESLRAVWVC